jgi:hypothetical protein
MWRLPVDIIKFWYFEAPVYLLRFFVSLNKSFINAFSLSLMIKTLFRPWKNEYREGLVRFSIFMGFSIKSMFIAADLLLFVLLVCVEIFVFIAFLLWPLATFYLPFVKI